MIFPLLASYMKGSLMRTFTLSLGISLFLLATPVLAISQEPSTDDQKTLYALGLAIASLLEHFP
jgi:FKBP-type peptidyl-prolyl cis-trans isomerase FkpA/FKBP-type peptidyl-prolyl cis-trans isomerase FklB